MISKLPIAGIVLSALIGLSAALGCTDIKPKAGQLRCDDHSDCPSNWYCAEDMLCYPQEDTGDTDDETDTDTGTESNADTGRSTDSATDQDAGPDSGTGGDTESAVDTDTHSDSGAMDAGV